ncbi:MULTISPECIES: carbohydrate ABC transporter permease [unclassified Streptomyces]|uniref:carbohydrate ABC transporter permease n=1 Tax=unclassified Streptomyces TaxID=2593676 RepID=UPI002E27F60D|nr:carbohydrate ABC transporter permease [Streptomyces sp. NBC_01429]
MRNTTMSTARLPRALLYAVLTLGAAVMLVPFAWMVLTALKPAAELGKGTWLPERVRWGNFADAFSAAPFDVYFRNSLLMSVSQTLITVVFASAAGYALARTPIRGRGLFFGLTVGMIMVPVYVILIPRFLIVRSIPFFGGNDWLGQGGTGWLDSWWALIVPGALAPLYIFLARQFYVDLPDELADAARIDGLSEIGIWARVMTPLIKPAVITIAVFQFQSSWNDFLWPLLVTRTDEMRPIQLGLAVFSHADIEVQWNYLMAGTALATLPMIALFLVAQRYFVEGMASAGLKG